MKCEICGAPAVVRVCDLNGLGGRTNRSFCATHAQEHLDFPRPWEAEIAQWRRESSSVGPDDPPIVRLLDLMIEEALKLGSPRIELEVAEDCVIVQYEVNGDLVERDFLVPDVYAALLARIRQLDNLHTLKLADGCRVTIEYRGDGGVTLYPDSPP